MDNLKKLEQFLKTVKKRNRSNAVTISIEDTATDKCFINVKLKDPLKNTIGTVSRFPVLNKKLAYKCKNIIAYSYANLFVRQA